MEALVQSFLEIGCAELFIVNVADLEDIAVSIDELPENQRVKPMLDVENLAVAFAGQRVVEEVSFQIRQGETLALVGESGSGKSVSALALMRLLPATAQIQSGRVALAGRELLSRLPNHCARTTA